MIKDEKIIYKDLSFQINGLLFAVHNEIGRYGKEKQYGDLLARFLQNKGIKFDRELPLPIAGIDNYRTNIADFLVEDKILIEIKAKPVITREDYDQIQRYLQAGSYKLGLLVNFRNRYLRPIRIIRLNS